MFRFFLPHQIDDSRVDSYLNLLQALQTHSEIAIALRPDTRISPAGHSILACLTDAAFEQKCRLRWPHESRQAFLEQLSVVTAQAGGLPDPSSYNYETGDCVTLGSGSTLNMSLIEKLDYKFQLTEDLLFDCKLMLQELMQNAIAHSGAERYFVYVGIHDKEIHCGVLDMGVSIPARLRQKYDRETDVDYLELALQEGSTTRRIRAGGLGLFYFREFLKRNGARLTIVSGNAQIRYYFRTRKSQKSRLKRFLPGTWCFARFPLFASGGVL